MKLTKAQYTLVKGALPRQRENISMSNLQVLNTIVHVAENCCKWRALLEHFDNWNTIYVHMNRWAKSGSLTKVFEALQRQ